jgi:phosphoglycolate phosphatase
LKRPGILFDLDGTLADTAPDLVAVLNRLLAEAGRPPVPYAIARNQVSHGAVGLLRLGFGFAADTPVDAELRQAFLELYEQIGNNNSRLFIELQVIAKVISTIGGVWGIVTNKPEFLTRPLLERLGVAAAVSTVVCGDTLPERKPHPAPLRLAAEQMGLAASDCIYLGDAERDIQAGRAAGMRTIATSYGYIRPSEDVTRWQADATVDHPRRIAGMLTAMVRVP